MHLFIHVELFFLFCCRWLFYDTSGSFEESLPATSHHTKAEKVKAKASSKDQTASCGPTRDALHCHHRSQRRWPWTPITSSRWASAGRHHRSTGSNSGRNMFGKSVLLARGGSRVCFWGPQWQPCCFPVFFPELGLSLTGTDKTQEKAHSSGTSLSFKTLQMIQMEGHKLYTPLKDKTPIGQATSCCFPKGNVISIMIHSMWKFVIDV